MASHQTLPTTGNLLHPEGVLIRAIRIALAGLFLFLAVSKVIDFEMSAQALGDLDLAPLTVWTIGLMQLLVAGLLVWRITYPLAALFILLYGCAIMAMYFLDNGTLLPAGIVIMGLAALLAYSDQKFGA
jgi:hypothetical protein